MRLCALLACAPLAACALQAPYAPPVIDGVGARAARALVIDAAPAGAGARADMWWRALGDPAIDALTASTLASNPTLEQAGARIAEARANAGAAAAATSPTLTATASATRAGAAAAGANAVNSGAAVAAGLDLGWELDLFGKLRESREAARRRVDARDADAALLRLSLAAQVASGVIDARACLAILRLRADDVATRAVVAALVRRKRAAGFAAAVTESRAAADAASAESAFHSLKNGCDHHVNALAALSGLPAGAVMARVGGAGTDGGPAAPAAPRAVDAVGADVLRGHPRVIAAERELAAAYAELGAARAERYPAVNLSAMLGGQTIRAGGAATHTTPWSFGAALAAPLFDGGRSAAGVDAAAARWRLALAVLSEAVRGAAQDIANALADQASTAARVATTAAAADAAEATLRATDAQWRAGAVSLFELQDAAHTRAANQEASIAARRDRALAWVALLKATANAHSPSTTP